MQDKYQNQQIKKQMNPKTADHLEGLEPVDPRKVEVEDLTPSYMVLTEVLILINIVLLITSIVGFIL